jgi:hypothetical protein
MNKLKKLCLMPTSEWGSCLHTALRKCCDSTATTIAYNAICELHIGWEKYLRHVTVTAPDGSLEAIKKASLKWDYLNAPRQETNIAIILHCSFELFSHSDWEGYVSFLRQEE